jgi:hypothetical protein
MAVDDSAASGHAASLPERPVDAASQSAQSGSATGPQNRFPLGYKEAFGQWVRLSTVV